MHYSSVHHTKTISKAPEKSEEAFSLKTENLTFPRNVTGLKKDILLLGLKLRILKWIIECYSNPVDWYPAMKYLFDLRASFLGKSKIQKIAGVQGKYYSSLFAPAINDKKFKMFIRSELNRFKKIHKKTDRLNHVFLAITKKCPLQCEHCYEWERLNKKEVLNKENLKLIIQKLQKQGVSQIYFTGGEPLLKFEMILQLLKFAESATEFWLNTSGYQLTDDKAKKLKAAGLTGLFISLDHHKENEHDNFRNYKSAYSWATKAAKNAIKQGLVVTITVCVRKEFVTTQNLFKYMELGKNLGVSFIQFIEPKPVGHFKSSDVSLSKEKIQLLESFFEKYNFNKEFIEYPLICYHEYYQRRIGCLNKDNRGLYIDSNGGINPCTFCHKSSGNILDNELDTALRQIKAEYCPQALNSITPGSYM